ncbi:MAG: TRAP dicarboxylate transporter, DctM subunit, unknown substrate 6, partial [uncultured Acetobacteraceae bacterium]
AGGVPADRLPGRVLARRDGPVLRLPLDRTRLLHQRLSRQPAAPRVRHPVQRPAAGDPVLHPDGRHPGALRPRRGPAGRHRPALRQGAGRPRLRGDPGGRRARRHHRHRGRFRHRHGHDLAAHHDALWLRHADRNRRDRRVRHHHPGDPAVPGADRAGRPARQVGRRHVRRGHRPLHPAGAALRRFHRGCVDLRAAPRAGAAGRSADPARLGALVARAEGHGALHRADLPGARHHLPRPRHADGSRRHGRGRRGGAGHGQQPLHLGAAARSDGQHHADHRHGDVHPDRRHRVLAGVPGRGRVALDRAPALRLAGRQDGLPDLRQHLRLLPGVLPRLLRDRLHRHPAARARRGQARHRPGVVRGADLREHADQLHAPALRLRAVLPARHRAQGGPQRRHLLGRHPLGGAAVGAGGHRDLLAGKRDLLARRRLGRGPFHRQDRGAAARHAGRRRAAGVPI